jgi:hypothetical protein
MQYIIILCIYSIYHLFYIPPCSVTDPGCLSRILIFTHPGSRIPDPKTEAKESKKLVVMPFLQQVSHN